jgi:predicted nucleotidyltransferase
MELNSVLINPNMGFIIPNMGDKSISLTDALFTKVQQRVLGVLYGNPQRSFYGNEVVRLAESGIGAVQRELEKLCAAGLVVSERIGNQRHFRANQHAPIFDELAAIIAKTVGVGDVCRQALRPLADKLDLAFIYGSIAKGHARAESDVDVLLVSNVLMLTEVYEAFADAESRLGRPIHPTLYTVSELRKRLGDGNHFVARVIEQPKVWLIGTDDELATIGKPDQDRQS